MELFALYNQPCSREAQVKFYTVKVPLKVQPYEEGVPTVEANWLDHMTQHFNNGASLVDGYFHLGDIGNGKLPHTRACTHAPTHTNNCDIALPRILRPLLEAPLIQSCC